MILSRILRFAFHLLYQPFAFTYDWVAAAVSAGLWKSWVTAMGPLLSPYHHVLEVGHGPGHLLVDLYQNGHDAVGVDFSPQMGRIARRRLVKAALPARLVRADGRYLPFPDSSFDAVVATFPAEYIAEKETWLSFRRLLSEDGVILVLLGATPLGSGPLHFLSRLLFRITGQQTGGVESLLQERLAMRLGEIGIGLAFKTMRVNNSSLFYVVGRKTN